MEEKEIVQKLDTAIEHLVPDSYNKILSSIDKDDIMEVRKMENNTNNTNTNKFKRWIMPLSSVAAVLVVVISIFGYNMATGKAVDSIIGIDVNPSINLEINKNEKVLDVVSLNDEADKIIDGMDLKGTSLDVAMNAIIGSMLKNGFIDELSNSILISVGNDDKEKSDELRDRLTKEVEKLLQSNSFDSSILSQVVVKDNDLQKLADDNNISLGKAEVINGLIKSNNTLKFEDLAKLSINDLNLLSNAKNNKLENVTTSGEASNKSYIGTERALELALAHLKINKADITNVDVELDYDALMVYDVDFDYNNKEYEIEIDATSGAVVKSNYENDDNNSNNSDNSGNNADTTKFIGKEKALEIALNHAGVKNPTRVKNSLDNDDNVASYEIEFYVGNTEYDYDINATTGKIIKFSSDKNDDDDDNNNSSSKTITTKYISKEKALQIALNHAGVKNPTGVKNSLDNDDNVASYEIEFYVGNTEYDYDINATTGKVIKFSSDKNDDDDDNDNNDDDDNNKSASGIKLLSTNQSASVSTDKSASGIKLLSTNQSTSVSTDKSATTSKFIGKTKALQYALNHAGVKNPTRVKNFLDNDRTPTYEIEFYIGSTEYDYEINAKTGKVVEFSIDKDDNAKPGKYIGKTKALQYALNHAKVTNPENVVNELDNDNSPTYEIEFYVGNIEYDYEIDAVTGKVVEFSIDKDDNAKPGKYIGKTKALQYALNHAKVKNPKNVQNKLDDDYTPTYEIEFYIGTTEYEYEVDAITGKIVEFSMDIDDEAKPGKYIGKTKALQYALNHAGVKNPKRVENELDNDYTPTYEIEFYVGNTEYDYEIDAVTGKVLEYSVDRNNDDDNDGTQASSSKYISKAKALQNALAHAKVKNPKIVKNTFDMDDNIPVYEIEFYVGRVEYDYEINAITGKIVEFSIDRDDD